ncbi:MAG: ROK family protein [Oscillospiraceae bacterium]|nr:ROK family protein [Oscillospiraceae bacterium]
MNTKVLAADIGGSKLMMGCVDINGKILDKTKINLEGSITRQKLMDAAFECSKQLDLKEVCAVGVNIPGLADVKKGLWVHAPYSGISDFPVADEFSKMFGLPVVIENDVNACALAEKRFGLCKNINDYIWVTISNGIGGSVVLNRQLHSGYAGNAGEIGHFIVEENGGFVCGCGNTGCLEAQAAGPAIAKLYGLYAGKQIPSDMRSKQVGDLARAGDSRALAAFEKAGYYIGKALSYAVNFVNPEAVVLGGGVVMDEDLLMPPLERNFRRFLFEKANKDVKIMKTALGYDAALLGAATLALNRLQ